MWNAVVMPELRYRHHHSTYDTDARIRELNREIRDYCAAHPAREEDNAGLIRRLLRRACAAAAHGAQAGEGGPFGAMLVDFGAPGSVPEVVGFGTNHVATQNDPTQHAEMTAIRDAARRLGRTDLSGLTLITSCECCPMCLAAATGCKVKALHFAASRLDAAGAGFSDADQYRLMQQGGIERHATRDPIAALRLLEGHDAAVLVPGAKRPYFGDYARADPLDPTDTPCLQAIRAACREHGFHLPEDALLISRDAPHPLSLIAADWARIGRIRGADANDPAQDAPDKDRSRILYARPSSERMTLKEENLETASVPVESIWAEIRHPRAVAHPDTPERARSLAFSAWKQNVETRAMPRY